MHTDNVSSNFDIEQSNGIDRMRMRVHHIEDAIRAMKSSHHITIEPAYGNIETHLAMSDNHEGDLRGNIIKALEKSLKLVKKRIALTIKLQDKNQGIV